MQQKTQQPAQLTEPAVSSQQPTTTPPLPQGQTKVQATEAGQAIAKDEDKVKQLIQAIRIIQNEQVEQEVQEALTEAKKDQNTAKIKQITKQILLLEYKIDKAQELLQNQPHIPFQKHQQLVTAQTSNYQPSEEDINQRYTQLSQQPNDSSWTDATESQADDDIWVVDDEIMKAMEEESEEGIQEENNEDDQNQGEQKEEIDLDDLEDQFVTGEESDHHGLFGKHDKFCVSVNGIAKESLLVSGGGDDYLYMYRFPKQELDPKNCLNPYHLIKHTETVNKIEISYSKQYIFSMTDNQVLCTEIKTQETTKLKSKSEKDKESGKQKEQKSKKQEEEDDEQPICSDMVCHHLGDVVAVSSGYELEVYNIKGLKLYQTYYCERMIEMIAFTQMGKQIVLACQDSRLRLLTPKTSEIVAVTGTKQHQSQISVIKTKGDIILSGCLDGYIGITSIKKASMTTLIGTKQTEETDGAINQLEFAGSYFISGSAEDKIDWYDLGKAKKLFASPIQGSSSDICWQGADHHHLYNVSTIKGYIHIYDCRNPLKQIARTRAGNTIHKLWAEASHIAAACEDGHVRYYDIRKLI